MLKCCLLGAHVQSQTHQSLKFKVLCHVENSQKVYFKINLGLYDMENSAQYLLKVNNNSTRIASFDIV